MLHLNQSQIVDEEDFSDIFIDDISNETETYYNVLHLAEAIANSKDPEAVIAAFDRDPQFHDAFNSNGKNALDNMTAYLDASNEGLGLDAFKYGPLGLIAGSYYQSLSRIKNVCSKYEATDKTMKRVSLYLPNKDVFFKCISAAEVLFNIVTTFNKNPNKPFTEVVATLEKHGIKCNAKGNVKKMISADWPQIFGVWLVRLIGSSVTAAGVLNNNMNATSAGSNIINAAPFMGSIFSRNRGSIGSRGWTPELLNKAREKVINLIGQLETLKKNKGTAVDKNSADFKYKVRLYKCTVDVYANLLKEAGRGVASALALIR